MKKEVKFGTVFNMLEVISGPKIKLSKSNRKKYYYLCKCLCGTESSVEISQLKSGKTKSCGCLVKNTNRSIHGSPDGEASFSDLYSSYRIGAKNRNYEFSLNRDEFDRIITQNCHYCGSTPVPYNRYVMANGKPTKDKVNVENINRNWIFTNTIDRIDNDKGYILENCVPCCVDCNSMKLNNTYKRFIDKAYQIVKFQESKK